MFDLNHTEEEKKLLNNLNKTFKNNKSLFKELKDNTEYYPNERDEEFYDIRKTVVYGSGDYGVHVSIAEIFLDTSICNSIGVDLDYVLEILQIKDYSKRIEKLNSLFSSNYKDINGVYFRSINDQTTNYIIEFCEEEPFHRVKIYSSHNITDTYENLKTNDEVTFPSFELEYIGEILLCNKYFFPKFNNNLQLYYDRFNTETYKSDSLISLAEAFKFAIDYGIKKENIRLY